MDAMRNPFNPGAGTAPPFLVGRDRELEAIAVAIGRISLGRFERSIMLKGLRGVGKTVLLNEFGKSAVTAGWLHEHIEATEDVRIAAALAALARRALLKLSVIARSKDRATRALGALRSFIKVHVPLGGDAGSLTIDFDPVQGAADSGQLDGDISGLFVELGEAARAAGTGVLFTIDEIQYLAKAEFSALIIGLHRVSQLGLPVLVVGAGLPSLPGLAGEARSYAERLFRYVDVGSLSPSDARSALELPVQSEGAEWSSDALDEALSHTRGYPYFLQEIGKQSWNVADGPTVTVTDVRNAYVLAVSELDEGFFRARIDRTTDAERDYLRAMASLGGPGPYRSGDVSQKLGRRTTQTGPTRDSLLKRGLCYSPRHGEVAFTVPMFDEFVRRNLIS